VDAGYKEIVITGVHLGSYGRDFGEGLGLVDLVRALAAWKDEVLFRLSSIEPMDCTPAIIDLVAGSERLAPHFHLPLQHGADDVLTAMQRPYTVAYYEALVERIRRLIPDAAIGSDIIVGFPGETNAHFSTMCTLLEKLPLTHLHVFPYSDRPGTAAARLSGKVEGNLVRRRGSDVRAIGTELAARFRRSQVGKVRRALTVDDGSVAVTDNYLRTAVSGHHGRNEWVSVRL
jgi:threonylcarbamoyladenosine tRNA methylthiotransferase MtaB